MDRGIQATAAGVETAKHALKLKGWTQEYLSGVAGCTRQTILQFLKGKRIEKRISQDICNALDLKWGEIVELEADEQTDRPPNLDELVETVRVNIYDSIQTKCGTMRVLDMTQPIDLNAIYTNVNILEKITGRQRLELQELLQSCSLENYDRFSLSGVQEARIPALEAIDKYTKLMILGKPGAGKTTFLKYVALQCIEGTFKPQLIPLFITLKDFAEVDNQPSLFNYITQLFKSYGIEPRTKIQKGLCNSVLYGSATNIELLLLQGRFAILLDGLDEVRESDSKRVLQQIQDFSDRFAKNIFAITCRIAAKEYTFEKFTEVEVADFDNRQIATFTKQWFQTKNDPIKAENFIKKLKEEPSIRELASSPLLLILLCLIFGESGSFPSNRSELYKEGLDVLLKKWDAKRNIERDRVYKQLSLKRREDLLSQIALDTFEKGNYFFKQKEAEHHITQYIRNLPDANTAEDALKLDSEAVLKSIEAQHGLFVERARGIYSFSHLTFHEYFTARKIVLSANSDILIQKVASYITDKRWREVLLLTCGMLENTDLLLKAMKQNIDSILSQDEKLQRLLKLIEQKSSSIKNSYKPAAIRSFYMSLNLSNQKFEFDLATDLDSLLAHEFKNTARIENNTLNLDFNLLPALKDAEFINDIFNKKMDFTIDSSFELKTLIGSNINRKSTMRLTYNLDFTRNVSLDLHSRSEELLQKLKNQLPDLSPINGDNLKQWWKVNGQRWTDELRSIVTQHRNIGHDWQFSEAQEKLLQQYYDANKLLVDCLNSDCYVSREVREEIESTLLLPIASIHKRKSS
ncbi:NACHT domain-containing NTPase [Chamaesiphon sp. VAR_48_metabat_403]|uniref:NACHT domain-containing NTPase n=1 Tax=Chamaesiphon sp. VAR_48_metabat_403 TaxID=2964700 RepID=UPI00286E141F|nr:NACHT domain-containing NTPase [Chamaesiphon sp. VAR_48_metabat_403]